MPLQHAEVHLQGQDLVIKAPEAMMLALKAQGLQRIAAQVTGKPVRIRLEVGENLAVAPIRSSDSTAAEVRTSANARCPTPPSSAFRSCFPDAQVRTVRNLNE